MIFRVNSPHECIVRYIRLNKKTLRKITLRVRRKKHGVYRGPINTSIRNGNVLHRCNFNRSSLNSSSSNVPRSTHSTVRIKFTTIPQFRIPQTCCQQTSGGTQTSGDSSHFPILSLIESIIQSYSSET